MNRKILAAIFFVCLTVGGIHLAVAGGLTDVKSTLGGTVTWTVAAGTHVEEGSEIIRISTLTGSAAAARASSAGTVREVLVRSGDAVQKGMTVARIAED